MRKRIFSGISVRACALPMDGSGGSLRCMHHKTLNSVPETIMNYGKSTKDWRMLIDAALLSSAKARSLLALSTGQQSHSDPLPARMRFAQGQLGRA